MNSEDPVPLGSSTPADPLIWTNTIAEPNEPDLHMVISRTLPTALAALESFINGALLDPTKRCVG